MNFWKDIWSEEKEFNEQVEWVNHTEKINEKKQHLQWNKISKDKLEFALNKSHKWKSRPVDKIPNIWISFLSEGHEKLASLLSEIAKSPGTAAKWLSEDITYFQPKLRTLKIPKTTDLSLV